MPVTLARVVGAAEAQGGGAALFGNRRQHVGHFAVDRLHVGQHQRRGVLKAALVRRTGAHQQQVGAHRADAIDHRLLGAVADREHRDHRGDADHDAEQRQHRSEYIGTQSAQRGLGGFGDIGAVRDAAAARLPGVGGVVVGGRLRAGVGDDAAVLDLDHARRVLGDFARVRDQDHRVTLRPQVLQLLHHVGAALAVERAGRLVGQDHAAAVHQRACDRDALLLSARQLIRPMVRAVGEAEHVEEFTGACVTLGR